MHFVRLVVALYGAVAASGCRDAQAIATAPLLRRTHCIAEQSADAYPSAPVHKLTSFGVQGAQAPATYTIM